MLPDIKLVISGPNLLKAVRFHTCTKIDYKGDTYIIAVAGLDHTNKDTKTTVDLSVIFAQNITVSPLNSTLPDMGLVEVRLSDTNATYARVRSCTPNLRSLNILRTYTQ